MDNQVLKEVESVFRKVFKKADLNLHPADTAAQITGWDSLTHMTLINEIELNFGVNFSFEEVTNFKNVGDLVNLISSKIG